MSMGNWIVIISLSLLIGYYIGFRKGIGNQEIVYGDSGFPKNCRAIVASNVMGVNDGQFTPEEALGSIDRNCGADGYSWSNR